MIEHNSKTLTVRTLVGFAWAASGKATHSIIQLIVLVILARLLDPWEFGVINAATIVPGFAVIFSEAGIGPAIVQRHELDDTYLRVGFTLSIILGFIFTCTLWIIAPLIAFFFEMETLADVVRLLSISFLFSGLSVVSESLMKRNMQFKKLAYIDVISYFAGYGLVGITLAFNGYGVWSLAIGIVSQSIFKSICVLIAQGHTKNLSLNRKALGEMLSFGIGMTLAKIGNYFAIKGDFIVVGKCLGATALGVYGRAYQFLMMPTNLIGEALNQTLFPAMSLVQSDKKRLAGAYLRSIKVVSFIMLPLSVVFVMIAPELIFILLGAQWKEVIVPFQVLSAVLLFRTGYKVSDCLTKAAGAVYRRAWRHWFYAALVITGALCGQYYGVSGVAIGVAAAIVVNYIVMAHLCFKLIDVSYKEYFSAHLPGIIYAVILGIIMTIVIYILRKFQINLFVYFITTITVSIIIFIAIIKTITIDVCDENVQWISDKIRVLRN